uniref:Uncharacterized protein n=1 Tax=Aegilops tauschii subsp. strangulata TaxID=200361 RepID=A0A453DWH3_AEGTS
KLIAVLPNLVYVTIYLSNYSGTEMYDPMEMHFKR